MTGRQTANDLARDFCHAFSSPQTSHSRHRRCRYHRRRRRVAFCLQHIRNRRLGRRTGRHHRARRLLRSDRRCRQAGRRHRHHNDEGDRYERRRQQFADGRTVPPVLRKPGYPLPEADAASAAEPARDGTRFGLHHQPRWCHRHQQPRHPERRRHQGHARRRHRTARQAARRRRQVRPCRPEDPGSEAARNHCLG